MKKQITLSLITAAILGLNGCGGDSSGSSTTQSEASSLIQANSTVTLENQASLEAAVKIALEKNTNMLKANGLLEKDAKEESKKFTSAALSKLNLDELEEAVLTECKEEEKCKEEAYASFTGALTDDKEEAYAIFTDDKDKEESYAINTGSLILDKEEAYAIAQDFREDDKEEAYATLVNDGLVKEFTCETGEVKTVQHYGIEDVFDTSNGNELAYPNSVTALTPNMVAYNNNVNAGFAGYDNTNNNRQFLEDIKNLPSGITSGRFYIGLKSNGSSLQVNDTISIGDLTSTGALATQARFADSLTDLGTLGTALNLPDRDWSNQLVNSSNPTTAIYWNDFKDIEFFNGQTLLDHVQTNTRFDAYVQDDTSVDFITVATCSKPEPIKEIIAIVNQFECNEKEGKLFQIVGGEIDALASGTDTATPSNTLETIALGNTVYPNVANYDYTSYDHHFVDTLTLPANYNITKAEFNIGYKVIGSSLHTNDAIYVGEMNVNHSGGHLYDNTNNILTQGWTVNNISNGEKVAQTDLTLPNTIGTGNVLNTMKTNGFLDVYVQDDTAVDFTQLNLCVTDNCDEDAKDIKLDLSKLASWTEKPSDAEENSVGNPNVWAADMNWIKFDNDGKERILKIPFCACGDTLVNIEHLKGDNIAEVTLDSTSVAYQPWSTNNVTGFIADSAGGNHVDGSQSIAGTGVGVNHVLELNATNLYSSVGNPTPFGVAVDGTLTFKGNLGKCK